MITSFRPFGGTPIWWSILVTGLLVTLAKGHSGRRFEVDVSNGQLVAIGYNSGASDGVASPRPYTSSIHDHWQPFGAGGYAAVLPGFSVFSAAVGGSAEPLVGGTLSLQLTGASVWTNVPQTIPVEGWVPQLEALGQGFLISAQDEQGGVVSSGALGGSLTLAENITLLGDTDLDVLYSLQAGDPAGSIFVLEWILSVSGTMDPLANSEPIHTILAPPGANAVERRHFASLFLEESLGTPVPEPSLFGCMLASTILLMRRKRTV